MRVYTLHHNCTTHGESASGIPGSPPHNLHIAALSLSEESSPSLEIIGRNVLLSECWKNVAFEIFELETNFIQPSTLRFLVQDFVWR